LKLVKLLVVPGVVVIAALMAVPVYAHSAEITKLTVGCGTGADSGKICAHVEATLTQSDGRSIRLKLQGHPTGSAAGTWQDIQTSGAFVLKPGANTKDFCFGQIPSTGFALFRVVVVNGDNRDLDLSGKTTSDTVAPCVVEKSPTPMPTRKPTPTPTPKPSASTGGGAGTPGLPATGVAPGSAG
jgi:hypothetical protein